MLGFSFLKEGIQISLRKAFAVSIITSGTLSWFFFTDIYFLDLLSSITSDSFWIFAAEALFFGFGGISAIIGGVISSRVNRRLLLGLWIFLGVLSTASLILFKGVVFSIISGILLGMSLGLGFPSCTALLADFTDVGERARVSGIIILETFVMVAFALIADSLLGLSLLGIIILGIILRSTSFFALILDSCDRKKEKEKTWKSVLVNRNFLFYLIPFMMFNAASALAWVGIPKSQDYEMILKVANTLRYASAAFFGLVSGIIADRLGRKLPIIIGLSLLGVSFALLGYTTTPETVLFYLTTSGVAWGFLMVVYLAIPGDLAYGGSKEKFYSLGTVLPLVFYMSLGAIPRALSVQEPSNVLSPILSIILFLSVFLVWQASETLPENRIYKRKLKEHIRKVGEIVQKSK